MRLWVMIPLCVIPHLLQLQLCFDMVTHLIRLTPDTKVRPFSPPKTSNASPPPTAPLARAESSSSLSSNASLSAANTPTVGKFPQLPPGIKNLPFLWALLQPAKHLLSLQQSAFIPLFSFLPPSILPSFLPWLLSLQELSSPLLLPSPLQSQSCSPSLLSFHLAKVSLPFCTLCFLLETLGAYSNLLCVH